VFSHVDCKIETNPTMPMNLKLRCEQSASSKISAQSGWTPYAKLLHLAHSCHFPLVFVTSALQLNGGLVLLHLVQRSVVGQSDL
jgi:hypothetical protein